MSSIYKLPPFVPTGSASAAQQDRPAFSQTATPSSSQEAKPEVQGPSRSEPSLDRVGEMVEARVADLLGIDIRLTLERDEEAGVFVYKAVSRTTGEVVRQYPTEEMLKLLSSFHQGEGLSVNSKV